MSIPHLLIVAHGSRSKAWNNAVVEFAAQADAACRETGVFSGASAGFMEHGRPSITGAIASLSQSNTHVTAQPLFLSVSQHVTVDIPNEFARAAQAFGATNGQAQYQHNGCVFTLLPPPQAPELLAQNAARRIQSNIRLTSDDGVIFVYYGTKSYIAAWDALAQATINEMQSQFAGVKMTWAYAGDMAGFSPDPLAKAIDEMAQHCRRVVILPALVAKSVIQNEVIPAAVQNAQSGKQAVYFYDAVRPDPVLAKQFSDIAARQI